ncbi:MAG: hypothetical protein EOP83_35795 [Verrucomicrobiaceae bacterium]|nr:MAG: hypothetical protein EOP83_35795 [Verrucomicrobiaceae bacterium]
MSSGVFVIPTINPQTITTSNTTMATNLRVNHLTVSGISFNPPKAEKPCFMTLQKGTSFDLQDYFDGPLPRVGDRVEMVCVERKEDLMLKIQLRTIKDDNNA